MTRPTFRNVVHISGAAALYLAAIVSAQQQPHDLGFKDTPILPGQPWHVHDSGRPHPPVVTPGPSPGAAPSDATVLFDGKDLSKWAQWGKGADKGKMVVPAWKVRDGYFEAAPGSGDLFTREKFGDCQLHVEWQEPTTIRGASQDRGNSGVYLMSRYEIQVLDAWQNPTYADGQAAAIYGQWPPLVNPARMRGEWNTYDIVFEAPKFQGDNLKEPAYFTVFYNGVVVHNRKASMGPTVYREVAKYRRHEAKEPLQLQDHGHPVRFRNIWIRPLGQYDQPER
ncbi:MAG TPA: DUF1080 domain-containing protein [Bryobacteraceae bacterium]|jgi:hypothetical protein|nr:DUF1080 domain-containing protein [Bryobacteraceae bacterium]